MIGEKREIDGFELTDAKCISTGWIKGSSRLPDFIFDMVCRYLLEKESGKAF